MACSGARVGGFGSSRGELGELRVNLYPNDAAAVRLYRPAAAAWGCQSALSEGTDE
jgi:hypothetical protein